MAKDFIKERLTRVEIILDEVKNNHLHDITNSISNLTEKVEKLDRQIFRILLILIVAFVLLNNEEKILSLVKLLLS